MKTAKEFWDFLKEIGGRENDRRRILYPDDQPGNGQDSPSCWNLTVTELNKLIDKTGGARQIVKTITADLSPTEP